MSGPTRTPPRFVPTLTSVVELPPELPVEAPPELAPGPPAAASNSGNMIENLSFAPVGPASRPSGAAAMAVSEEDAFRLEEQLLHRVLQRVDLSLEEQLTDSVSAAVQRQLDSMLPLLRAEIETVLRRLVVEALAQELSETPGSMPPLRPTSLG